MDWISVKEGGSYLPQSTQLPQPQLLPQPLPQPLLFPPEKIVSTFPPNIICPCPCPCPIRSRTPSRLGRTIIIKWRGVNWRVMMEGRGRSRCHRRFTIDKG